MTLDELRAMFPPKGGITLRLRQFGPKRLNLVAVQMDHFFDYGMEFLAERGHRVERDRRWVEGAGTG